MARPIVAHTTLRGWLRLDSALHTGDGSESPGVDAAVARDGQGWPVIRGTGLAGAFRRSLGISRSQHDGLLGWAEGESGQASRLWIEDAVIVAPPQPEAPPPPRENEPSWASPETGTRFGIAVDRADGAVVEGMLRAREMVAAGSYIAIRLGIDSEPGDNGTTEAADLAVLSSLAGAMQAGIALGARTSRGWGRASLQPGWVAEQIRYDDPSRYLATLLNPERLLIDITQPEESRTSAEIIWTPYRTVFVGAGTGSDFADALPLLTPDPDRPATHLRLIIPGDGIAGALRTRAELIARTARDLETPRCGDSAADRFRKQITQTDLVTALFGEERTGSGDQSAGGAQSAVEVHDCLGQTPISRAYWRRLVTDPLHSRDAISRAQERLSRAQDLEEWYHLQLVERTAVDRWTGGAATGMLRSRLEAVGETWSPLTLKLDWQRLPAEIADAARVLLLLTLRDLAEGWVPLGGNITQGLGAITVDDIRVTGIPLPVRWWEHDDLGLSADWVQKWRRWWQQSEAVA
jgi:CRISPR/Cas system CSM-associated protein Csm3 (group 7 of RAMP superfamily)